MKPTSTRTVVLAWIVFGITALASLLFVWGDVMILKELYNSSSDTYELYSILTISQERLFMWSFLLITVALLSFSSYSLYKKQFLRGVYGNLAVLAVYFAQVMYWQLTFDNQV